MTQVSRDIPSVGFDLDGVLLYNPARTIRPFVKSFKHKFIPKREGSFYIPRTKPEELFWSFLHLSSIFPAGGWHEIQRLVEDKKINAYVVTARFGFMKPDIDRWMKILNKENIFTEIIYNTEYQQPHIYKEKTINRLKLDYFVEDNWDIVKHLSTRSKARTYWVYNIFDKNINYKHKVPSLKRAVDEITKSIIHK